MLKLHKSVLIFICWHQFSSVQSHSCVLLFAAPWTAAHQASLSITNLPGSCSDSCPSSHWCHPTISSSVIHFSSCLQCFPASESFLMNQFFASGGQNIGASASVPPMNIKDWFPVRLTGLISLHSKGLSRVFSNTTVQKHQFFSAQLSLWSNSQEFLVFCCCFFLRSHELQGLGNLFQKERRWYIKAN